MRPNHDTTSTSSLNLPGFFVEQNINVPFEINTDFLAWKRKRLDPCAWWTSGLSLKRGLAQSSCHSKVHMKNWRMVNHKGQYTYMSHSVSTHVQCVPSSQAKRFFFQKPTKTCQERVNKWTTFLPFTMFQPNLPGYTAIPSLLDVPCHASPMKPNWGPQTDALSVVVSIVTPAPWMHGFEATAPQVGETTMVGRWVAYPRLVL